MRPRAALVSLTLATLAAGCATAPKDDARASLVEAERAFARMSVERGLRDAFLANFADDGIAFEPAPVRLREAWGAAPPPAGAKPPTLDWHPVIAGVARSGALGFTSGPFTLTDPTGARPPGHGVYFSVWRRGTDGVWKVAADAGIRTPQAVVDGALLPDPVLASPSDTPVQGLDSADAAVSGESAAFAAMLANDARWHVDGRAPVIGREAIAAARASDTRKLQFVTLGREAAASGDLGTTYGRYDAGDAPAGYYLHVWNRDGARGWRLVVAVHLAGR
jgi:ketosteroid isomerase-like protein